MILARYFVIAILRGYVIVAMALLALFALFAFMEEAGDIGEGAYSARDALLFVAMGLPVTLLDLAPFIVVLGTIFGLAGAVWTNDSEKAQRVARGLRHGTIWINDYHPYVAQAEWGGFKQSGNGRELGEAGLAEYLEHKHIWQNLAPAPSEWFVPTKGQVNV